MSISQNDIKIFGNLFVLEAANNHCGDLERGLKLIRDHAVVARQNNVRAAVKLQFRKMDTFVHPDYKGSVSSEEKSLYYIQKTEAKALTKDQYQILIDEIKNMGCIPMSTPFDEDSVDLCVEFDLPIIKIASSDMNDWPLIEKIASTRRPVIVSSGGASEKDLDDVVSFFAKRDIPLCINHCVSLYPSEDDQLHLDQIDYLKNRYPDNVIGFSSHEYHDWSSSMMMSYAKGARSWERHIDIEWPDHKVQKYCSLPHQCDEWFKSFHKSVEMAGGISTQRRPIPKNETKYLDALVRGIYAKEDLKKGLVINSENFSKYFYLAIPLNKGQLSCREVFNGETLKTDLTKDEKFTIDNVDGPFDENKALRKKILERGL
jgi:N-acetylneuraminate synthase